MTAHAWVGLRLDPLDTLFFRDGRPFGPTNQAEGGLPNPQTLAGALRTALLARIGFDFAALARRRQQGQDIRSALGELGAPDWIMEARFRGPWLAEEEGNRILPLVAVPAILARTEEQKGKAGAWFRGRPVLPREVPGWPVEAEVWPLWTWAPAQAKHPGGFLTPQGLNLFLQGKNPTDEHWRRPDEIYHYDQRTGIRVDPEALTSAEGFIYALRVLVLKKRVCFYTEAQFGAGAPEKELLFGDLLPLGGEGRYVKVRLDPEVHPWQEAPEAERSLWLLTTAAFLHFPHQPGVLQPGARVRAAAAGAPVAISGWDVARNGPHPTRFAVPAGATYFIEGNFTPANGSFCTDSESVAQGWGHALRGTWNHE